MLAEYKDSRSGVRQYIKKLTPGSAGQDNLLEISKDMYCEISSNLTHVRRNYLFELSSFLKSRDSFILTQKQHYIMTLRSEGLSMEEIGKRLDISKTAVYKSIKLSEKKIAHYFDTTGLTDPAGVLVSGGGYEQKN